MGGLCRRQWASVCAQTIERVCASEQQSLSSKEQVGGERRAGPMIYTSPPSTSCLSRAKERPSRCDFKSSTLCNSPIQPLVSLGPSFRHRAAISYRWPGCRILFTNDAPPKRLEWQSCLCSCPLTPSNRCHPLHRRPQLC